MQDYKSTDEIYFGDKDTYKLLHKEYDSESSSTIIVKASEIKNVGCHVVTIVTNEIEFESIDEEELGEDLTYVDSSVAGMSSIFIPGVKIIEQKTEGLGVTARFLVGV